MQTVYCKQHKKLSFYRHCRVAKNANLRLNYLKLVIFSHTETEENSHSLLPGFFVYCWETLERNVLLEIERTFYSQDY